MKSKFYQQKQLNLPVYISLPLLLIVFGALFYTGSNFSSWFQKKANHDTKVALTQVKVGNLLPESVTIFFQTSSSVKSELKFRPKGETEYQVVSDERLTPQNTKEFTYHLIALKNLRPDKLYEFQIIIGNKTFEVFGSEKLEFRTPLLINTAKDQLPVYGKILNKFNQSQSNAIAMLETSASYPIFAPVKTDGSFVLSTCCLLDFVTLESPKILSSEEKITINFFAENQKSSKYEKLFSQTHGIETGLIFGESETLAQANTLPLSEKELLQVTPQSTPDKISLSNTNLEIQYPQNNKSIPGTRPLVAGLAKPNSKIRISFLNEKKDFELSSASDGKWSFSPSFDLQAGKQSIKVTASVAKSPLQEKSVNFIIQKSGEAVLGAVLQATDEAKISLTPTLSQASTSTPTPTFAQSTIASNNQVTPMPPESGADTIVPSLLIIAGFVILSSTILFSF